MSTSRSRILAGICLLLAPFIYIFGVGLYHSERFFMVGEFLILGWMSISLIIGVAAALTYRLHIFGFNCGSFLCYSVAIMVFFWTLQVNEVKIGAWLMYGYFAGSFLYGCFTLVMSQKSKWPD